MDNIQLTDDQKVHKLVDWYLVEYKARTDAIESGSTPRIDWLDPETRISFSEVWYKAQQMELFINSVTLRVEFDRVLNEKKNKKNKRLT